MLVISRKTSESVIIGDDIEIVVTEIGSERVKLGINAPKGVPILRKELLETREMNREAAGAVSEKAVMEELRRLLGDADTGAARSAPPSGTEKK